MSYTAYESSAGEALAEAQSLCRHAARGSSGTFTSATTPVLSSVERWLTQSYYWIIGLLRRNGLSATQTDTSVVGYLQELNVYDSCVKIEMSLPTIDANGEPSERFKMFEERRNELVEGIKDGTLAAMGAGGIGTGGTRTPVATGLFISRKRLAEEDTDRTQHRVRRGQFNSPGGIYPLAETDVEQLT